MPHLIDSHCHLHFPAYDADRDAVLARMRAQGIWGITVGTNATTSRSGVAFANEHPDIFATVGYHPEHLTSDFVPEDEPHEADPYTIQTIAAIARSSAKVVAIGETGLDFYRIDKERDQKTARETQERALLEHVQLAQEMNLPLVIHCREALGRLAELLRAHPIRGVVHCFTGTWAEAKPLLDLGLFLSFTGIITFAPKSVGDIHDVIQKMPLERLLVETDAPWLAPVPYRGKRNEPTHVQYVAAQVALLRGEDLQTIAQQTTQNACQLFGLKA